MILKTDNLTAMPHPARSRARAGSRAALFLTIIFQGLLFFLLSGALSPALAVEKFCSDPPYFGVIDGDVHPAPTQITIDRDCTFQNFPASKPLTTTLNFQTNDPSIYLIIFNNVQFTGHMACANVDHRIWFANGSDYGSSNSCQDLFIPVESIDKQSPAATAAIGVPFTYTLTLPSMTEVGGPSQNDLHTVTVWDDLRATGVDLRYVDAKAYYRDSGTPVNLVPENDPNAPGGVWTSQNLSYKPIALIPQGEQIIVELTVVLADSPANVPGASFVNTAKWSFGRLIEGTFYEPLPGEWGISQPMTIAQPGLVVTKTSNETAVNLGTPVAFTVDVQNVGGSDAWNVEILDRLPEEMCDQDPAAAPGFSARIVGADGSPVTALTSGTDFAANFAGAPDCALSLEMLTDRARLQPSQHLLIDYQAQLDADVTTDGLDLVNVAGAIGWSSADPGGSYPAQIFRETLSDGTPGILDHEDSQTVTTALSGYYFQKTVENLTSGADPATTAAPGDRLRYRIRLFNVDQTITSVAIDDLLSPGFFLPGTFTLNSLTPGAAYSFDAASGLLKIQGDGAPLTVGVGEELVIEFDIDLRADLANNTLVDNQAILAATGLDTRSDDPYVNGIAPPDGDPPPDVTRVIVQTPGPLQKENTRQSATIGEQFQYTIRIPETPVAVPLYDVRIVDDLLASGADLRYVSASVISGGAWTLVNTGTATSPVIEDPVTGIDIPANGQAEIAITVALHNSSTNQSGLSFDNRALYTYNRTNGNHTTRQTGGADRTLNMTVVEPDLNAVKAVRFVSPPGKQPTDPAAVGDILEYRVTVTNGGDAQAFDISVTDGLPANLALIPNSATAQINGVDAPDFLASPAVLADGSLVWGRENNDVSLDLPVGQSLVLTYQVTVEAISGVAINNSAYLDWTSLNGTAAGERTGAGCPDISLPNDYCFGPVTVPVSTLDRTSITKTVVDDTFTENPAATGNPVVRVGDSATYTLTLELREFVTSQVVVEDSLPAGMVLESFTISSDADMLYSLAAQPAAGDTGTLRWDFGDVTNLPSGDGTPLDTLVIRYVARVVADPPPAGVGYDAATPLNNRATLAYAGGDPAAHPERLTAEAEIEVRQPQMSAISKVDRGSGRLGSGTVADPYQVTLANDVMNFRLSSCNEGAAPAYGVAIRDRLAPEFDEGDLILHPPVVAIGPTILTAGSDYSYVPPQRGGTLEMTLANDVAVSPGECLTVDYQIGFHTDLSVSKTWSNQARLTEYQSLPPGAGGRVYGPGTPAEVWLTNRVSSAQLLKSLISPSQATVGDEATYRITVPAVPMNRAVDNVIVRETLPDALVYVGAEAADQNGAPVILTDLGGGTDEVNLGIGGIPAGGQVIITLTTRVANNEQANAGHTFSNTASYTYTDMPADLDTASTSAPLLIVEPEMRLAKSVANLSRPGLPPRSGDILRYSVTFSAVGGEADDNFGDAFDLTILDNLETGLVYQNGTATISGAGNLITDPAVTGDGVNTPQVLRWGLDDGTADIDVGEGTEVILRYDVMVAASVQPGQELTNQVEVQWTGQDGDSPLERDGSGVPAVNDYFTGPAAASLVAELAVSMVKSVVNATSGEVPGDNAEPGDTLRYTLVISNESIAPLQNGWLTDDLAAFFAPGSLRLIGISQAAADNTRIDPSGGSNGTGLVDIRNLNLAARGEPGDTVTLEFEATLEDVINSGTAVTNQAELRGDDLASALSNQTSTLIHSAPALEVWKTSEDLTGDPLELLAGETLRYTITLRNSGNENAVAATLRDLIPANTRYVANSTTLNGFAVADPQPNVSPLRDGLAIHSPQEPAAGVLAADPGSAGGSQARVTFEVVVNSDVVDGTIIANQGFLTVEGIGSGVLTEEPSDDPDTQVENDPTRDVVGNVPLIDAYKTVAILVDNGSPEIVDPGDVLRYTIAITNTAATPATGVVFTDGVPADTTYVAGSARLNGAVLEPPADGSSPLAAGIEIAPGEGLTTTAPEVVTFDVRVNDGVPAGTIISNQGVVGSLELPDEPTDADGDDTNGDQPTEVVVGAVQQVSLVKDVFVVDGGTAEPGSLLEYVVMATNIGSLPATAMTLTDDLGALAGQVTYVAGSARLEGFADGVTFANGVLAADYAGTYGPLAPGRQAVLRFQVRIDPAVAIGTTLTNVGLVRWSDPARTATAQVSLAVGGNPDSAALNGNVWHDADLDGSRGDDEQGLEAWSVQLYRQDRLLATVLTDASGAYRLSGLNAAGGPYTLRFVAAGAGRYTPSLGQAISPFTNGPQRISDIEVEPGSNLQDLHLPITPNGRVYDSVRRSPVPGARLGLRHAVSNAPLPGTCFHDPVQQDQLTAADGFYKFDVNFNDPACPFSGGESYVVTVIPPDGGYQQGVSQIIPPGSNAGPGSPAPVLSVPACPGSADDALPETVDFCEVTTSADPPSLAISAGSAATRYYLALTLGEGSTPNDSQAFNNHLPVDPVLDGAVSISKTSPLVNVSRGQLVPYVITLTNQFAAPLGGLKIVDTFPAGFKYVAGSGTLNGEPREPEVSGRQLTWSDLELQVDQQLTLKLLLVVGAGVTEDEYVNRAQVFNAATDGAVSGVATATVRVVPDPTFDCTDVIGKVFDDRNFDGRQDPGESGLAGVRLVTARGLIGTTDPHGRFHITCAMVPDENRGSNFILKLDDRSLPSGYRLTTENPRVQRATRGKMMKFNFGATVHRVVGLDCADGAFEPAKTKLRVQWHPNLRLLVEELKKAPSVLRLSYLADVEPESLVNKRLQALRSEVARLWRLGGGDYPLTMETEVFWRRGGPQ